MSVLLEACYLPPVSWFSAAKTHGPLIIEQHENYNKGSYRNRCHLAGSHGLIRLSIPLLKGKHRQMPIREVEIDYREGWVRQHWRSIQSAYGKSPFFEFYMDELKEIYDSPPAGLFDWNMSLINWLFVQLSLNVDVQLSTDFVKDPDGVLDLRDSIRPGKSKGNNKWETTPKPYPQVFQDRFGFIPDLSILDLLFCQGPQASVYI
ncbi:MAG: WbqC family protein [Bacteroidetes bacterium]|nr:WbqC family protein [Bacteroidota bacterium]